MKYFKIFLKLLFLFLFGGATYYLIEILWRGYSHWSMMILGGICFIVVGALNNYLPWEMEIEKQSLCGSIIITFLEFVVGYIVNIKLKWHIWDYSLLPFNIMGQVCLPFSLIWLLLSLVIIILDDFLRYKFFNEDFPHYKSLIIDFIKGDNNGKKT